MTRLGRRMFLTLAGSAGLSAFSGCIGEKNPDSGTFAHYPSTLEKKRFPIVLSSNENPFGPSPEAVEAGINAVRNSSHLYSREHRDRFSRDLADHYRIGQGEMLLGCGAIELLKIATDVFCSPRNPPIISEPVYEAMDYYAGLRGIRPIKIPVRTIDMGQDLQVMLDAASSRDGLIYVCNPCNPTGRLIKKKELTDFIRQVPEGVITVIDEAYAEYVGPEFFSCMNLVRSGAPNLIVVRTFSKIYGLAGLRVGYCAGNEELIRAMVTDSGITSTNPDSRLPVRLLMINHGCKGCKEQIIRPE